MCTAPCRIAACLPLYADGLCIQSHVLPSAFKTVCPLLKHCGGAFLLHTGVSQDGVASGWRFSKWRRFRVSMKSQHQGRRAEGRSVSAMCQTHRSSGLLRSSRSTPNASIATLPWPKRFSVLVPQGPVSIALTMSSSAHPARLSRAVSLDGKRSVCSCATFCV